MTIHKVGNKQGKAFRSGLSSGKSIIVPSTDIIQTPQTSKLRRGLGRNVAVIGGGGITPQTINVPYVADGNYRGVFYQIGTELESIAYANPSTKQNGFKVNTVFESVLSTNVTTPHEVFIRPAIFSNNRTPQHSADGNAYFWVTLPSGFWLKPSGIVIQSRTDFNGFHLTNFTLRACSNTSSTENRIDTIGSYSTGFTGINQFYVNSSISSSSYYNSFKIQRDANSTGGTYLTMAFLELYGELKIYNI